MSTETIYVTTTALLGKCQCGFMYRIEADIEKTERVAWNGPATDSRVLTPGVHLDRGGRFSATCKCGQEFGVKPLQVGFRQQDKCGGRCRSAIGAACDCECGGKNHGSNHAC